MGMKILVIDDEAPIRLLCRVNLEAEGMEVLEGPPDDEARIASENHPASNTATTASGKSNVFAPTGAISTCR